MAHFLTATVSKLTGLPPSTFDALENNCPHFDILHEKPGLGLNQTATFNLVLIRKVLIRDNFQVASSKLMSKPFALKR